MSADPSPVAVPADDSVTPQQHNWILETRLVQDFLLYLRTAVRFVLHPKDFGVAWEERGREVMNPLPFMGFAVLSFSAFAHLEEALVRLLVPSWKPGGEVDHGVVESLLANVGPYLHYACLAALAHAVISLAGSKVSLRDSVAMALYVGGGPAVALLVFFSTLTMPLNAIGVPLTNGQLGNNALTYILVATAIGWVGLGAWLGAALSGLHGSRPWSAAGGVALALVLSALFFGVSDVDGNYGFRVGFFLWPAGESGYQLSWGANGF